MDAVRKLPGGIIELDISQTVTISFKLEEELLEKIDSLVKELGYQNRSDLIRDAIYEYLRYLDSKGKG